ncbi:MAG: DUF493 domain-containing protein [Bdellovibrionales bacterium]|jgi:uncharacterized protein|nr:DUF493 domain-containing protein [Bdellovibrionales bacterium]MBT3527389.1 DUF493 domain-containing protein [Bdellovibrionales bacterium]MBT7669110.1 DUF493 domain-containing protein [Bdellovibrionales bacterium]MBT7766359.1 DUF493 domain-containing protein [Bdellovibrionales bacterium]
MHDIKQFQALLDQQHSWPCDYRFTFIVPVTQVKEVLDRLGAVKEVERKESTSGKFISIGVSLNMQSSTEVIAIYEKMKDISGIVPL